MTRKCRKLVYRLAACAMVSAAIMAPALAQVPGVPPLDDTVNRTLERRLPPLDEQVESGVEKSVDERLDELSETADEAVNEGATEGPLETAGDAVDGVTATAGSAAGTATEAVQQAAGAAGQAVNTALRPFTGDIDPFGHTIEKNVLVVLVDTSQLADVTSYGLRVIGERSMPGLGLTLVTLEGQNSHRLAQTAVDLRRSVPEATVDFNHLYRPADDGEDGGPDERAAPSPAADADTDGKRGDALRIGMIDSAVAAQHRVLTDVDIVQKDFVTHEAERPLGHGTAVASLLAEATSGQAEVFSASVFFQVSGHAPGATTESLVAALDWLATVEVDAINMSLAGPANALLERALVHMDGHGPTVVAAVGNNGPGGDPQYPAAYEPVIGVTAVDRESRIFRYANRGQHVAFAALGVNVKVADIGGGWRIESGTSMASPLVAAVAAGAYRQGHTTRAALVDALIASAEDLGRKGFDTVFGHGLITRPPTIVSDVRTRRTN